MNGDTWVILGDSVTEAHKYSDYIETFYYLRYPNLNLHFRVEGRGGSTLDEIMKTGSRYHIQVYSWSPTIVSIMDGRNEGTRSNQDFITKLNILISDYIQGESSATPVLFGSHPTYSKDGGYKFKDFADDAKSVGIAGKYPYAQVFDRVHAIFLANMASKTPIDLGYSRDFTHPGPPGNLIIAYTILKELGVDGTVSSATINYTTGKTTSQTDCTISNISKSAGRIDFDRLDTRLPWTWDAGATVAVPLIPTIYDDLSAYILTITGLPSGRYDVFVDDTAVAQVTATDLANGWNMSSITKGPIYEQCQEVLGRIRDMEGLGRNTLIAFPPWTGIAKYRSNAAGYYRQGYRGDDLKAQLASAIAGVERLENLVKSKAQPTTHTWSIRRAKETGVH